MAHDAPEQSLSEHDRALLEAARQAAREAARQELLRVAAAAGTASEPAPVPRTRKGTPNPYGLHIVRGLAVPLGAAGVFLRGHVRHAVVTASAAAVLAGGTLAPDMMQPAPAAQVPRHSAVFHHEVRRHHQAPGTAQQPVAVPGRRRRRVAAAATAAPRPSPVPSATATGPGPLPSPLPSVTVPPPVPDPVPTCTPLTEDCGSDQAVVEARALRGLPRLS